MPLGWRAKQRPPQSAPPRTKYPPLKRRNPHRPRPHLPHRQPRGEDTAGPAPPGYRAPRWLVVAVVLLVSASAWALASFAGDAQAQPPQGTARRAGGTCTGSMAPALTCVDEATYRTAFDPADIEPGHIISFQPGCPSDDGGDDRSVAHRVMEVRVEQGRYSYWPKGDARREADGCWVPAENVNGYLIAIHQDVRPENMELRDEVAAAAGCVQRPAGPLLRRRRERGRLPAGGRRRV